MNKTSQPPGPTRGGTAPPQQARSSVVVPVVVIGILLVGIVVGLKMMKSSTPPPAPPPAAEVDLRPKARVGSASGTASAPVQTIPDVPVIPGTPAAPAPAPSSSTPVSFGEPTAYSRDLVASLAALNVKGPITKEQAQQWKQTLQTLVQQGPSAVAGIQEFLAKNQDVNFGGVQGADQLGSSSLRDGLINALNQIGGPEATSAMLQTMQSTTFPADIAELAKDLQQQAPGQYQEAILNAVKNQLSQGSQGALGTADVGSLFPVLLANGGTAADLQQLGQKWPYYQVIGLTSLPDGGGVAALTQMASGQVGGNQIAAAEGLAQMASQNNSQAMNNLLDMVKNNQLSDLALARLAPFLAGQELSYTPTDDPNALNKQGTHIAPQGVPPPGQENTQAPPSGSQAGPQNFASYTPVMTTDQMNAALGEIDKVIQAIPTTDTSALNALQQQRAQLQARMGK